MAERSPRFWIMVGLACALVGATFFALSLVSARITYDHGSNAQTVMFIRFSLLTLLMLAWNRWQGHTLLRSKKEVAGSALTGAAYFVGIGSYLASVAFLPVSLAVIIFYTFPILIVLVSALLAKRIPGWIEVLALLIAFAGLIIALDVETEGIQLIGLMFAVFASLGVTLNMVGSGYVLQKIPTTVFSFYLAITNSVLAAIVLMFTGGISLPNSAEGWWAFLVMLLSFMTAFIATYTGVKLIGAVRISTVMNLEPVITIVFAVMLLGELFTAQQVLGGVIVLSAIFLAQWRQNR